MREKFLADGMNGDLARWLRILGYNCKYPSAPNCSDEEIIEEAEREDRIVLTGDKVLYRKCLKRGLKAVYTEGTSREERLANLAKKSSIDLSWGKRDPRCSICNALLDRGDKELLAEKIPRGALERYKEFWVCPSCGKIYWEGSHWKGIRETIEKARDKALEKG